MRGGWLGSGAIAIAFIMVLALPAKSEAGIARDRIFRPSPEIPPIDTMKPKPDRAVFKTADGLDLTALVFEGRRDRVYVFFHGNGGNQFHSAEALQGLAEGGDMVVIGSYRGYGGNPGSPSEHGLIEDGRGLAAWLKAKGYPLKKVYLVGYSLGTNVALKLSAENEVAGVVLFAPFTSVADLAPKIVRFMIADKFENLPLARANRNPLVIVQATGDRLVPCRMGLEVYRASAGLRSSITLPEAQHALTGKVIADSILEAVRLIESGDMGREPVCTVQPVKPPAR